MGRAVLQDKAELVRSAGADLASQRVLARSRGYPPAPSATGPFVHRSPRPLLAGGAPWHAAAALPAAPEGNRRAIPGPRLLARAAGLAAPRGPTARAPGVTQREAVELLRAVAEGVGLLRVRGDRLEATSLRHAWAQIDEGLRAGLVYAAWCQQVTLTG
jgi:hypothetical protein